MNEPKKPIFWFDMDGVLARYDYSIYQAKEGETPKWLERQSHVFRDMIPDNTAITLFRILYSRARDSREYYTRTLTGIAKGLLQGEHTIDKYLWMCNHVEGFSQNDFFCTSIKKHSAVAEDLWKLTPHDILIDDYNPNLENWRTHGGTPVKYVNGINSTRNDMPNLCHTMDPWDMAGLLETVAYNITNRYGN